MEPEVEPTSAALRAISQTRPFRSAGQEAAVSIMIASDRFRRRLAGVVEPHGVTVQQYNVLRILRGAEPAGLATLDIGNRMIETTPGITRLLDRLEEKKLVTRKRRREDRRQVHCRITAAGMALLASLDNPVDALDEQLADGLNPGEVRTLNRLLSRIIDTLGGGA